MIPVQGKLLGKPFFTPKGDIREAGQWQQWVPPRGTLARSNIAGKCMIVSHKRSTNMSKLYAYVMTTPIAEVRCVGVWNVIVAWHRGVHMGRAPRARMLYTCHRNILVGGLIATRHGRMGSQSAVHRQALRASASPSTKSG